MSRIFIIYLCSFIFAQSNAQLLSPRNQLDSTVIRQIFDEVLLRGECYQNLHFLCKNIGHRLTGSDGAKKSVEWVENTLLKINPDTVFKQLFEAPYWVRGANDWAILNGTEPIDLQITALGGSIGTIGKLTAQVIVVDDIDALESYKNHDIEGKIVLFNKPMDKRFINTFQAYGACVSQRFNGASEAAKKGAVAVLVRSLTTQTDHFPHTGVMAYSEGIAKIPAAAISTAHADLIAENYSKTKNTSISINLGCEDKGLTPAHNVIGEIRGSENPEKIMVIGAHLDSWDLGEGAHDDGAGVVHCMEVIRLFNILGIKPRHTIRAVLYMNEENGNAGGKHYAQNAKRKNEQHIFALETDRGGFSPRGFTFQCAPEQLEKIKQFAPLLEPYYINLLEAGYGGVDIGPLNYPEYKVNSQLILSGLMPDSQRYFDLHHTDNDVFENINQRELELGAGAIAAIIYLLDQYWEWVNL